MPYTEATKKNYTKGGIDLLKITRNNFLTPGSFHCDS